MSKLLEQINTINKETASLASFIDLIGGGTPKTTIKKYWNGDIPWLSVVDFNNDSRWVSDAEKKITEEGVQNSSTRILNKNDIIISARGTVGVLAQLSRPMAFNQSCYGIRAKDSIDQNYLFYLLKSSIPKLTQIVHGAVFDTITKDSFEQVNVSVPDLPTQKKIAEILSAYDEKIENNNKIIKNLEETAQIIFNEWFINFKFPGYEKVKMIGSEIGEIPEGWEIKNIGNVFDIKYGKNLPTSKISDVGKFPVYGAGGIIGFYKEKNVDEKVILVTCRGNGSGKIWRTNGEGFVTNNSFVILPKKDFDYINFISTYFLFKNSNVDSALSGSAQPQITIDGLNPIDMFLPSKYLLENFQKITKNMFNLIDEAEKENISLKSQRDLLLEKLI